MADPTREVFGNIKPWMQALFYGLMIASMSVLAWRVYRRSQLWRKGRPGGFEWNWRTGIRRVALYAIAQKRVHRKSLGSALHLLLYSGFLVLSIGTSLLFIAHVGPVDFHHGWYYLFFEVTMDVFGVAFCAGCILALYRRAFVRPASLDHQTQDWMLLTLLLAIGLTGFLLEALRIHYTQPDANTAQWSTVGWAIHLTLPASLDYDLAAGIHLAVWWCHALLVVGFFLAMPATRMLHAITAPINIAGCPTRPIGALAPVAIEAVERSGQIGVSAIEHFTNQQLLSLDACMGCGRCEEACPAWATGKPLSPKLLVRDLQSLMTQSAALGQEAPALHGQTIKPETLWSCTMCQACVQSCPVLINHVDLISDCRRHLVGEGQISGPPADALRRLGDRANPYGGSNDERMKWADGLDVPTVQSKQDFEYLLWVGCAAAFDPRAQKIARATVGLLTKAAVNFAILGDKECCTGDPARRLGDELLFQDLAQRNIHTLTEHYVQKIVTPCPHCFNTFKHEYPQFGGAFRVFHHTELLAELLNAGRLDPVNASDAPVTLHDPCYLARVNGQTDAPRRILSQQGGSATAPAAEVGHLREMDPHGKNTLCCGAGGGRMWFEEPPEQRIAALRGQEAAATGATTVATACPFCLNMLTDAMASSEGDQKIEVRDVAEILIDSN